MALWQLPNVVGISVGVIPIFLGSSYEQYGNFADFHCTPPDEYFFTVNDFAWKWKWEYRTGDSLEFKQVQQLEGDYAIERNKYVPPGPLGPR